MVFGILLRAGCGVFDTWHCQLAEEASRRSAAKDVQSCKGVVPFLIRSHTLIELAAVPSHSRKRLQTQRLVSYNTDDSGFLIRLAGTGKNDSYGCKMDRGMRVLRCEGDGRAGVRLRKAACV